MKIQDIFTAILFYLPFLLAIAFVLIALFVGVLAIFSGTIVALLLAAYGLYAVFRDTGTLQRLIIFIKSSLNYWSKDVVEHIQKSFLLKG